MTLLTNTAEGGSNGTAVTTGNSGVASGTAFTVVSAGTGGTITYSSTTPHHGSLCYDFDQSTAANLCYVTIDDTAATSWAVRFYLRLDALPSATLQFPAGVRDAADTHLCRVQMTAAGQIQIVGGATNGTATTGTALAAGTWYRFEFYGSGLNSAAGSATCEVYAGDATGTPQLTATLSGFTTAAAATRVRYGKGSSATVGWQLDDLAQNLGTATPLGPSSAGSTITVTIVDTVGINDTPTLEQVVDVETITDTVGVTDAAGVTTTSAILGPPTYQVLVDWDGDGTFDDAGEDITSRVLARTALQMTYGREQARALAPAAIGRASFDVDNRSLDYSPENDASPLAGDLAPGKNVLIRVTLNGVTYDLYRGFLDDYELHPERPEQSVSYSSLDALARLGEAKVTTGLHRGITTGQAIGLVLDEVGWPAAARDLDAGATSIAYWWEDGTDAYAAVQALVNSEGPPAFVTIGADGDFVFRDRTHRLRRSSSITAQATWSDAGAEPRYSAPFTVDHGWRDIVNRVDFDVATRLPGGELEEVWRSDDTFALDDQETIAITASSSDVFMGAVAPVEDVDFTLLYGVVTTALTRTDGQSTTILVTASGGPAAVTALTLRAYPIKVAFTRRVSISDSTSVQQFGTRSWPVPAPWAGVHDAEAIAQLVLMHRAQRLPTMQVRFVSGGNERGHDARRQQQFGRDLSDRVTLVNAATGLTRDVYVEQITHTVTHAGKVHHTTFGVEAVPSPANGPTTLVLGAGQLGVGTLGFEALDDPSTVLLLDVDPLDSGRLGH